MELLSFIKQIPSAQPPGVAAASTATVHIRNATLFLGYTLWEG